MCGDLLRGRRPAGALVLSEVDLQKVSDESGDNRGRENAPEHSLHDLPRGRVDEQASKYLEDSLTQKEPLVLLRAITTLRCR